LSLINLLFALERQLADPALVRPDEIADLLADDFVEFGTSGQTYSKSEVLKALGKQPGMEVSLEQFKLVQLAPDAALVTYLAVVSSGTEESIRSRRSSVWAFREGHWQILFHQGTKIPEPEVVRPK
jgi:hypothetical protein